MFWKKFVRGAYAILVERRIVGPFKRFPVFFRVPVCVDSNRSSKYISLFVPVSKDALTLPAGCRNF